jgi:branched-chain amino acid transport system ATP-binding protein
MLLQLRNVSKQFGGLRALSDISFSVEHGEVLGIIGANGAGKTTLFSLIAGHLRPTVGQILLHGRPIQGLRPDQICRAGIARTFQIVKPFSEMTVLENTVVAVLFGTRQEKHQSRARSVASDVLADVGLFERRDHKASSLTISGQKRLEIARAVATDPKVLLLDEVMAGLTAPEMRDLLEAVHRIKVRRSLTVLIVEHFIQVVLQLANRLCVLHHGEMLAEGPPGSVVKDERVIEAYLGQSQ